MAISTKPIPEGFHTVTPALVVRDAAKAIDFYKKALGAQELVRMPGPDGKIMHAELKIGDSVIFLSEEMPMPGSVKSPQTLGGCTCTLNVYVPNADETFNQAIAAGAKESMLQSKPASTCLLCFRYETPRHIVSHGFAMYRESESIMERRAHRLGLRRSHRTERPQAERVRLLCRARRTQ